MVSSYREQITRELSALARAGVLEKTSCTSARVAKAWVRFDSVGRLPAGHALEAIEVAHHQAAFMAEDSGSTYLARSGPERGIVVARTE